MTDTPSPGTLAPDEPHPAAYDAQRWLARHFGPHGSGNASPSGRIQTFP